MKKENGITLVALIITIIILLILAVVTILAVTNTGIFGYSENSVEAYERGRREEDKRLEEYMDLIKNKNKKGITLDKTSIECLIIKREAVTETLKAKVGDEKENIVWESSDESIVKISGNSKTEKTLKIMQAGQATITVKYGDKYTATCQVNAVNATSFSLKTSPKSNAEVLGTYYTSPEWSWETFVKSNMNPGMFYINSSGCVRM